MKEPFFFFFKNENRRKLIYLFTAQSKLLTNLRERLSENIVGKEENAGTIFFFSHNVFYSSQKKFQLLSHINFCSLQVLSLCTTPRFCHLVELNGANAKMLETGIFFTYIYKPFCHKTSTKRQFFWMDQIKSTCRRQFRYYWNCDLCLQSGRKHFGKRRKCWLPAFSFFPHNVFKRHLPLGSLKSGLCSKE